jgi:RNA polymerase sigma-70 factor (ECF subfamily)
MDELFRDSSQESQGPSHDDREVISGFLAGAPGAIRVIDGWIDVVLRVDFTGQRGDWDDLRQEVRIRVLTNLRDGRFHGDSELRTYVHRIAKNTAIDHWRRGGVQRAVEIKRAADSPRETTITGGMDGLLSRDLLQKILAGLSRDERRLLALVHVRHLSYAEVAKTLRIAEGTVKARVFRCRKRLLSLRRRLLNHEDA